MSTDIHIRRATGGDAGALSRIVCDAFNGIAARHNFPPDFPSPDMALGFLKAFTDHPRIFGVVAEAGRRAVGSNFLDQRDAIAGVGPITVDPAWQGRGAGRLLMQAVLERGRGAPGIRLVQDAFNTVSLSLYASLGFEVKEPLALVRGKPNGDPPAGTGGRTGAGAGPEVRPMREEDLEGCAALCAKVHGFDRVNELRDAIKMLRPFVLRRDGRVAAYASAPTFWVMNHGVAEQEQDMRHLLAGAAAAGPEPLSLLVPTRQAGFFRWCLAEGLRVVKPMTLMAVGEYAEPRGCYFPSVAY